MQRLQEYIHVLFLEKFLDFNELLSDVGDQRKEIGERRTVTCDYLK